MPLLLHLPHSSPVSPRARALLSSRSLLKCYLLSETFSNQLILKCQVLFLFYFLVALIAFF